MSYKLLAKSELKHSPVTLGLVAANTVIFFLFALLSGNGFFAFDGFKILDWGGNFNPYTLDGEAWRILSSMFLHFNVFHLAVNMQSLYVLGREIEKEIGSAKFLAVFLLCGVAGGIASLYWNLFVISAGASGAIFGLYGFVTVQAFINSYGNRSLLQAHVVNFIVFVIINLAITKTFRVDLAGHLGGLAFGVLAGSVFSVIKKGRAGFQFFSFNRFLLLGFLLLIQLFFVLPDFQSKYFKMFQALVDNERLSSNVMSRNAGDMKLREDLLMVSAKWDTVRQDMASLEGLPEPLLADLDILKEYVALRKEDLRFRITGIERESYIYRDSVEAVTEKIAMLPTIKFPLNFTRPPEEEGEKALALEYVKVYYDSSWQETTEDKAVYYRIGGKDSLDQWSGPVTDYYLNGKVQMKGHYTENLKDGVFMYYNAEQVCESSGLYQREKPVGKWEYFYSNGKLSSQMRMGDMAYTINYWDSTGRQWVKDGEGEMVVYYGNGQLSYKGKISNGIKEGVWRGYFENGKPYFEEMFRDGLLDVGRSVSSSGEKFTYDGSTLRPQPKGGWENYLKYIRENTHYPEQARPQNITGNVRIGFTVGADGAISDIIYLQKLGFGCEEEAKRILVEGPTWQPGLLHGQKPYTTYQWIEVYFSPVRL